VCARIVQKKTYDLTAAFDSPGVILATSVFCPQVEPLCLRVDPHLAVGRWLPLAPSREGTIRCQGSIAQLVPAAGPEDRMGRW
jgi:hypothetical protein